MTENPPYPPKPSRPPPPALPDGWVALWDEEYKRYYFANKVTGVTQWEVPTSPATTRPSLNPPSYSQQDNSTSPVTSQQYQQRTYTNAVPAGGVQTAVPVQQTVLVQQTTLPAQTYQTVAVPVAVPVRRTGVSNGLVTGLVVGSLMGSRRRRRR